MDWPVTGSVKMGRPVSQHRPLGGPPLPVGGGPCGCCDPGLTELVGLPGGLIIALVTAILVRGWFSPPVSDDGGAVTFKIDTDAGDGEAVACDALTVTGH